MFLGKQVFSRLSVVVVAPAEFMDPGNAPWQMLCCVGWRGRYGRWASLSSSRQGNAQNSRAELRRGKRPGCRQKGRKVKTPDALNKGAAERGRRGGGDGMGRCAVPAVAAVSERGLDR